MRVKDLERLYDYTCWANRRLFAVVSQLPAAQFTQSVGGSLESVRNTMVHILSAEWGWLDRCGGPPRGERLKPDDYPTLESIAAVWEQVEGHMRGFLSRLSDDVLGREVEFAISAGARQSLPLGDLLQHAIAHSIHHRGQVALLLRMLGHVPGNFDMLFYFAEGAGAQSHA